VGEDDLVERPLHVEHHRVERAPGLGIDPDHRSRVVVELRQAHRLRESMRRVDRQDADLAAALRGAQREGRRGRGLADAPCSAADDDRG
jgi:hypothetical protein